MDPRSNAPSLAEESAPGGLDALVERAIGSPRRALATLLGLTALAFFSFAHADLFWDDRSIIRPDGAIASLGSIADAFAGRCMLYPANVAYPYYRPLVDVSFILDYAVSGTHPFVYHLHNFVQHLIATALAFEIFRRLLPGRAGILGAFLGGGLFALHPLQCETVLWPSARPAMMVMIFGQLGMLACLELTRARSAVPLRAWTLGAASASSWILAVLCKEIAVALVPVALPLLLARDPRPPRRVVVLAGVLVLLVAGYVRANSSATGGLATKLDKRVSSFAEVIPESRFGLPGGLVKVSLASLGFYSAKVVAPVGLHPCYPPGVQNRAGYVVIGTGVAILLAAALGAGLVVRSRRSLLVLSGAGLYGGGSLLPFLGGLFLLEDHYMYQPLWGLGLVVAVLVAGAVERRERAGLPFASVARLALFPPLILLALALRQSSYWADEPTMWGRVLELDSNNLYANEYLAILERRGGSIEEAVAARERAVFNDRPRVHGFQLEVALRLGDDLVSLGRPEDALEAFRVAMGSVGLRSRALARSALIEFDRGRPEEGRRLLAEIRDDAPLDAAACLALARIALRHERDEVRAARWYERARQAGLGPDGELEAIVPGREKPAPAGPSQIPTD